MLDRGGSRFPGRPVRDVSALPDYAFGRRMPIWWGTLGYMGIEATGFVMAVAAYFYLAGQNPDWPSKLRTLDGLAAVDQI